MEFKLGSWYWLEAYCWNSLPQNQVCRVTSTCPTCNPIPFNTIGFYINLPKSTMNVSTSWITLPQMTIAPTIFYQTIQGHRFPSLHQYFTEMANAILHLLKGTFDWNTSFLTSCDRQDFPTDVLKMQILICLIHKGCSHSWRMEKMVK